MDRFPKIVIWVMCGVSLVLSLVAVCVACNHTPDLGFDYQGVIVGVLSLLVTVLIGWNIYTLIDLKNIQNKLRGIVDGTSRRINSNMTITEGAHLMIYHYLVTGKDPLGIEYRFIYHGLACIMSASQYGDVYTCDAVVKAMLECIAHPEKVYVTTRGKNDILKLISLVKNADKIEGFLELVRRVALLNVQDKH